ncbi:hypothetical protein K227x_64200 [Rubripirellula lacrimiformis]|uniref:Uncharacterized protein n=1 Tax=Rubripirellula lacrimiformis TaxID=1930273 RepID=A0A517NLI4_9BACT|nr:hypothetical protein [Rubripirellula lacrimiformis]QDT07990.1 hypothetical protein K227x_64200 [Rubripirellula lacrimiformis]
MSDFTLDGFTFDTVQGVINLPHKEVKAYRTPTSPHVGLQLLSGRAEPSVINVRRYDHAANLDLIKRDLIAREGNIATLIDGNIQYLMPPYQLRFAILDIAIEVADKIPYVMTSRHGLARIYNPACRIVAKITINAQPAY